MEVEMSVYSKENYVRIYMLSAWNRCKKSKRCFVKADSSDNGERSIYTHIRVDFFKPRKLGLTIPTPESSPSITKHI